MTRCRRLEEALEAAELDAIPRPEAQDKLVVPTREGKPQDIAALQGDELVLVAHAARDPRGRAAAARAALALRRLRGRRLRAHGRDGRPHGDRRRPPATRPTIAHDAKALTEVPRNLVFDTEVAAYLLDPARRGYPLDEVAEERGLAAETDDDLATTAVLVKLVADQQRPQIARARPDRPAERHRAPARPRPPRDREARHQARHPRARDRLHPHQGRRDRARARDLGPRGRGVRAGLARSSSAWSCSRSSASRRKRRGKTGYSTDARVLQAIRDEHEIIPKIERHRELSKLAQTYLDALPNWVGPDGRLHTTFEQVTASTGRLSSVNPNLQNIPIRTETGREIRACFIAEPGNVLLSRRLQPGRAARARPHRQRAGAARHLPQGRGRAHRDRERRLRAPARAARRRHALEGQDGQLRDRLRPLRLRPRRPPADRAGRGAGVHRPLPRALPGRRPVHEGRGDAGRGARLRDARCSAAAARSPRSARATGRRASSASGSRSTR